MSDLALGASAVVFVAGCLLIAYGVFSPPTLVSGVALLFISVFLLDHAES